MTSTLVHQAALLICESEVEWHLISTHQHMAYRTGMMSKSFFYYSRAVNLSLHLEWQVLYLSLNV